MIEGGSFRERLREILVPAVEPEEYIELVRNQVLKLIEGIVPKETTGWQHLDEVMFHNGRNSCRAEMLEKLGEK